MRKILIVLQLVLFSLATPLNAQDYPTNSLKVELLANANAVLREEITEINVESVDHMRIKNRRVVTVLNENGEHHVQAYTFYKDNIKILDQQARVYDVSGKEIKKFKKRHFEDRSYLGNSEMYGDSRLSYLNYKPTTYPYTVIFEEEYETNSTVFRTSWVPLDTYNLSIEKATYILRNPLGIAFRYEERNMDGLEVKRETTTTYMHYSLSNVPAFTYEKLSPDKSKIQPRLLVALDEFSLVGVKGKANNWKDFGKWQYEQLLEHEAEISQKTKDRIKELTAQAGTDREKPESFINTYRITPVILVFNWV